MIDPVTNFAISSVNTTYDDSATEIVLSSGGGAKFPDPSTDGEFNIVWWDEGSYPNPADDPNVEIVRVTARSTDTLTIERAQEGTSATNKNIGSEYSVQLSPTAKMIQDLTKGHTFSKSEQLSGTVDLTGDNQTVPGTGTSFTTELSAGDRVYFEKDGVVSEMGYVDSITNDTEFSLGFVGPTYTESGVNIFKVQTTFRIIDESSGNGLYVLDNGFIGINTDTPRYPVEINVDGAGDKKEALLLVDNESPYSGLKLGPNLIATRFGGDTLEIQGNTIYFKEFGGGFGFGDEDPQGFVEIVAERNAMGDVSDSSNYLNILRYDAAVTGNGAGLAFSVTNTDNNIGAAIIHERTDGNSMGSLRFYTKRTTTGGAAPTLAMVIDSAGNVEMEENLSVNGSIVGSVKTSEETGTSYTLDADDVSGYIRFDNTDPISVTVPANGTTALPVGTKFLIEQANTGSVTIVEDSGVTVNTAQTLVTNGQYSVVGLVKIATDTWVAFGDLVAS